MMIIMVMIIDKKTHIQDKSYVLVRLQDCHYRIAQLLIPKHYLAFGQVIFIKNSAITKYKTL